MTVERIEPHGFCAGVAAALKKARKLADASPGRAFCLHEIVHNSLVVGELENRGLGFVESLDDVPDGSPLLFSAHGVSPAVRAAAIARGMEVVDATCPFVERVHKAARQFAASGRRVVVVGKAGHAEVKGILGEAPGAVVAGSVEEAESLDLPPGTKIGVVCQTTVNSDDVRPVFDALAARFDAVLSGGACSATKERQDAVRAFDGDLLLVLGSPNSSNTRRLCEVARTKAVLADGMERVKEIDFSGVERLGVTSGASTPETFFEEAVEYLESLFASGDNRAGDGFL